MSDREKPRFQFIDEQWDEIVEPLVNDISDSLKDLQEQTGCPNETITGMLKMLALSYPEEG